MTTTNDDLPPGWEATPDPRTGKLFYFNRQSGERQWDKPNKVATILASFKDEVEVFKGREDEATGEESSSITITMPSSTGTTKPQVGNPDTFLKSMNEEREPRRHIRYDPTDSWFSPPILSWIPETNRGVLCFVLLYNIAVVLIARFTAFCGTPKDYAHAESYRFCDEKWILLEDKALTGFSVGMFLLLAFRANQSYDRWWEGRRVWGRTREACRDFARLVCHHVNLDPATLAEGKADRKRAIDYVTAYCVALKLHLRSERHIVRDLKGDPTSVIASQLTLSYQDVANIQNARHMPLFCIDVLSDYLVKQVRAGRLSDYQSGIMNGRVLTILNDTLGDCERILNTPTPLSYVLQLRFFLILWLAFYPAAIVAFYGWFAIPLSILVSTAVLGIESMSIEIENPFGYDPNDLNLDSFCEGTCDDTQDILRRNECPERDQIFDRKTVVALSNSQPYADVMKDPDSKKR